MRVTAAFSRLLALDGIWVRDVAFGTDVVVVTVALRRRHLVCPTCGYATPARYDTPLGRLDLAPPGPRRLAPRGPCPPVPPALSRPRGADRGSALRPGRLALHQGLRGPRRLPGDDRRQDDHRAAPSHRLGHRGSDHHPGDG